MPWHCDPTAYYTQGSTEADDNARMIFAVLNTLGWSKNAIAGLLGNIQHEGIMNPWQWYNREVQSSNGSPWTGHAYGLVQFNPASKYIDNASSYAGYGPNFSDKTGSTLDGQAQLFFIHDNADYSETSTYPISYVDFKISTLSAEYLAGAWLYNYERPDNPQDKLGDRQDSAGYYFDLISGETPTPTPTPTKHKMKWIFYLKRRY